MPVKTYTKGEIVNESLLVEKRQEGTTKTGKPYLNLTLRDKTGSIPAKLWDYYLPKHSFIKEGGVVEVVAVVDEYNGALQLGIREITPSTAPTEGLVKSSRFNVEMMWTTLTEIVNSMKEPMTRYVVEKLLESFETAVKKAPAAKKVHNAWYGGLLEHIVSLCKISEPIIERYKIYQPKLSRDKVLFGLICHDLGKVEEYDYNTPSFSTTARGLLTPHIVLGPAWVYELCMLYEDRGDGPLSANHEMEVAHLMHILAAHHGKEEWGSPVKPSTLEAVLVHQLDNLDSKMLHAIELIEGKDGPVAGFSERSYFEGTSYMKYGE